MTAVASGADIARLETDLDHLARISEGGRGVTRLAYTELERESHRWFASQLHAVGATVHVDSAGNTIGELPATSSDGKSGAIGTGSHLDSVPVGGGFDGVVGVVAAVEIARLVTNSGIQRSRPWRFVAFAAEEGARFGQACNGSRLIAGKTTASDLRSLRDKDGVSMHEAMAAVGLHPERVDDDVWQADDWAAFVELHIEQGTVLDHGAAELGVVDVISGSTRLLVKITGVASHSGGTPMIDRRDALSAAAECALAGEALANDYAHHGTRVTVGRFDVSPGSITTIPGEVVFSVDVRDTDSDRQRETASLLVDAFSAIAARRGTQIQLEVLADTSPVYLDRDVVMVLADAAAGTGADVHVVTSGASHDTQQLAGLIPVGMLFVPSLHGLSHVPEEYTASHHVARGVDALLSALRQLDHL